MRARRNIRLEELGIERVFALPELQTRADGNPSQEGRKQFRVWLDDSEVGFLAFETFWDDQLNLYEIFIADAYRNRGIGTDLIGLAIDFAKRLDKPRLTVRPTPLSKQPLEDLIAWYVRRGFRPTIEDPELFE